MAGSVGADVLRSLRDTTAAAERKRETGHNPGSGGALFRERTLPPVVRFPDGDRTRNLAACATLTS